MPSLFGIHPTFTPVELPPIAPVAPYRGVVGTKTATPCNAACTDAIGPDCSCSCGGANHGRRNYSPPALFMLTP